MQILLIVFCVQLFFEVELRILHQGWTSSPTNANPDPESAGDLPCSPVPIDLSGAAFTHIASQAALFAHVHARIRGNED